MRALALVLTGLLDLPDDFALVLVQLPPLLGRRVVHVVVDLLLVVLGQQLEEDLPHLFLGVLPVESLQGILNQGDVALPAFQLGLGFLLFFAALALLMVGELRIK